MKGKFPFGIQSKYPHMKPADVHLWEKFIRANAGFFDTVEYDFPVGRGPDWLDTERDEFAAKQEKLYQKKIDVLGFKGELIWIVEVKPQAGSSALGQVLTYKKLFLDQYDIGDVLRLGIVTNECQAGYHETFRAHGIQCFHVGFCPECRHYLST